MTKDIANKIKQASESVGGVPKLSKLSKIPVRTLYDLVGNKREPKIGQLVQISAATGKNIDWLAGFSDSSMPFLAQLGPTDPGMYTHVDRFEATVNKTASHGLKKVGADRLAFETNWLRQLVPNIEHCGLIEAVGDGQAPTISEGALLLVDMTPDQQVYSDCLYVLLIHGAPLVKRVHRKADGTVDLLSDNPTYPKETIPAKHLDRLEILGRVMWVANRI